MELTEAKVYEAFGLEVPGAKEQEAAEPVTASDDAAGAKAQEPAEPATDTDITDNENSGDAEQASESEGSAAEEGSEAMSAEERRKNASRRRAQQEAEQKAKIDEAVSKAVADAKAAFAKEQEAFFRSAGLKNTFTGEAITNMQQFNDWNEKFKAEKLQRELASGKLTAESLTGLIEGTEAFKKVSAAAEKLNEPSPAQIAEAAAEQERAKQRIDAEIAEIGKLDPSIKGVADLLSMEGAEEFKEKVNKGYSFIDAFRLVAEPRLAKARAEAAKQQAINNARSKNHMTTAVKQAGAGMEAVPESMMRLYKQLNPGATEAQITEHWNKSRKDE